MRVQLHDKGYRWPPIGVEEVATCGNIMEVGRWQCKPPRNNIIIQDAVTVCKFGTIPRNRGDRVMKEVGGKNDDDQTMKEGGKISDDRTMGRRVVGT